MRFRNLAKTGWVSLKANLLGKRIPLNVMLSVTNSCISRCSYCNIPARNQREMTTREIFDLIDQIVQMGAQRLGIWGGEPLLRDDIGQIVDYAKLKRLFVTMDTNGYLFPEKITLLKNLDHLILAFDGPEDIHDLNREKGSFKKVMRAIETIKRNINPDFASPACGGQAKSARRADRLNPIGFNLARRGNPKQISNAKFGIKVWTITVLTKHNINAIDFILDTAKRYSFLTTFQVLHHNDKLGRNLKSLLPPPEMYRTAIRKLIYEKKKGAPIASSTSYLRYILNWTDYTNPTLMNNNGLRCWAGRLYCNIDTDGSVYPCSLLIEKVPSLNFLKVGFKTSFDYLQNIDLPCKGCDASCYTEYNYLYSLNIKTIFEWLKAMNASPNNEKSYVRQ